MILPLLAITFAFIDFSFQIFLQNTLRNAVHAAVRFGITQQTGSSGQDAAIQDVAVANSMGFLSQSDLAAGASTFNIAYFDPLWNSVNGPGSNAGGNTLVVTATIQKTWMAPLWRAAGAFTIVASSADVMELPPNGVLVSR